MLTSNRKFGVEIEFYTGSADKLRKLYDILPIVRDGSLDGLAGAGEYVSPILQGEQGEAKLREACEILKKHGAQGDSELTSVHVHLDGRGTEPVLRSSKKKPDVPEGTRMVAVSNRLKTELGTAYISSMLRGVYAVDPGAHRVSQFGNITYLSKGMLEAEPKLNYTYYYLQTDDRFQWLRNVFYFYTLYSPVLESMVSNSRRFGNMYCIPLHKSYDLEVIGVCRNMKELHYVWYKGRMPEGHYDDSRYHSVNLHSYWDRHKTVEIRCHGGTVDPLKILLWVRLHQKIVDKLETLTIDELKLKPGDDIYQKFVEFIEEPALQAYVKRLLGFYSDIKLK